MQVLQDTACCKPQAVLTHIEPWWMRVAAAALYMTYHAVSCHFCKVPAQHSKVQAVPNQHEGNAVRPHGSKQQTQPNAFKYEQSVPKHTNHHASLVTPKEPGVHLPDTTVSA